MFTNKTISLGSNIYVENEVVHIATRLCFYPLADIDTGISSVVEYMFPFNENSSVQHIHESSVAVNPDTGQQYAYVVFDLVMAKRR